MTSLRYLLPALLCLLTAACHSYEEWPDDALGNFDALATIIDEHYCYLDEKGVDWQSVVSEHRKLITPGTTQQELFAICSDMLSTLEDGHVNLASRFDTYYYRRWWTDYPQDFNLRTLQQYYLGFDWHSVAGLNYKVLTAPSGQRIGYIFCPSFGTAIGDPRSSASLMSSPVSRSPDTLFRCFPSAANTASIRSVSPVSQDNAAAGALQLPPMADRYARSACSDTAAWES